MVRQGCKSATFYTSPMGDSERRILLLYWDQATPFGTHEETVMRPTPLITTLLLFGLSIPASVSVADNHEAPANVAEVWIFTPRDGQHEQLAQGNKAHGDHCAAAGDQTHPIPCASQLGEAHGSGHHAIHHQLWLADSAPDVHVEPVDEP